MTLDPRNLPFERPAPFLTARAEGEADRLNAESILLEEFNYAGVTAYQARGDSAALINLYLLASGALATGLGVMAGVNHGPNRPTIAIIATAALGIFAALSYAFFARFLDLEREYHDSVLAMEVIKEFYIQRLRRTLPEIELAFRWRLERRARGATLAGGAASIAWAVTLLGCLSLAGATGEARQLAGILTNAYTPYVAEPLFGVALPFLWETLAALTGLTACALFYLLVARPRQARAREEALRQSQSIRAALAERP